MEEKRREIKKIAQLSLCDKPRASACAQARVRHKLVQLGQRTASITRLFKAAFALWAHHLKYGLCGRD